MSPLLHNMYEVTQQVSALSQQNIAPKIFNSHHINQHINQFQEPLKKSTHIINR